MEADAPAAEVLGFTAAVTADEESVDGPVVDLTASPVTALIARPEARLRYPLRVGLCPAAGEGQHRQD